MKTYDFIIVGGGTAGCVVASRLTERPHVSVLLLEAGPASMPSSAASPTMWPALIGTQLDWCLTTVPQPGLFGTVLNYPRGKGLGGSSAINAMAHVRGHPASYEAWVTNGATGWGYYDLLPYFRSTETADGRGPHFRGSHGPMIMSREFTRHPIAEAFVDACDKNGYNLCDDLNGRHPEGVCWYDRNIVGGRRQSAADAYLRPALGRSNLTVVPSATATKMLLTQSQTLPAPAGWAPTRLRSPTSSFG